MVFAYACASVKMKDEQLIELVRKYPALYDTSDPKYMDNTYKFDIWNNKIGKAMKTDSQLCKTRWNNIRDNYRKSLRKIATKSGKSTKKLIFYKYSEQLSFLSKYFDDRETKGSIDIQKGKDEDEEAGRDCEDLRSQPSPSPVQENAFEVPEQLATRKPATKRTAPQPAAATKPVCLIDRSDNQATTHSQHPVDAFLASICPTLKALTPYYLNLAKSEIFSAVQKYEMKMLMEQNPHQRRYDLNFSQDATPHCERLSTPSSPASSLRLSPVESFQAETKIFKNESSSFTEIPNDTANSL